MMHPSSAAVRTSKWPRRTLKPGTVPSTATGKRNAQAAVVPSRAQRAASGSGGGSGRSQISGRPSKRCREKVPTTEILLVRCLSATEWMRRRLGCPTGGSASRPRGRSQHRIRLGNPPPYRTLSCHLDANRKRLASVSTRRGSNTAEHRPRRHQGESSGPLGAEAPWHTILLASLA